MKLTWQQVVLIVASLAALIIAGHFGGSNATVITGAVTALINLLARSPLTPKEEE